MMEIDVYHEIHTKAFPFGAASNAVMTPGFPFVDKLHFDRALCNSWTIWVLLAMQYSLHLSQS